MHPSKLSLTLLALALAGCEANGQDAGPIVPWVTTRPARTTPKGGWPTTMPAEAKAVMDRFLKAVDQKKWEQALSYCKPRTQTRAARYGREEYLRTFVPIDQLRAEPAYRFWTYAQDQLSEEYEYFGCFLKLSKTPDGQPVNWEWWLERTPRGWKIDLPDVPVEQWTREEIDRLKRVKEREEAKWKALEPKLKGLRTQLTALQREYRLGRPMPFRLELVNEGKHELSYDDQQVAVNASMIIRDEDGRVVPYTAGPVQTGGADEPIRPGERAVLFASLDIAGQYDIKKAGKYQVQFSGHGLTVGDAIGSKNGVARRTFPSNTVEIEVKP